MNYSSENFEISGNDTEERKYIIQISKWIVVTGFQKWWSPSRINPAHNWNLNWRKEEEWVGLIINFQVVAIHDDSNQAVYENLKTRSF